MQRQTSIRFISAHFSGLSMLNYSNSIIVVSLLRIVGAAKHHVLQRLLSLHFTISLDLTPLQSSRIRRALASHLSVTTARNCAGDLGQFLTDLASSPHHSRPSPRCSKVERAHPEEERRAFLDRYVSRHRRRSGHVWMEPGSCSPPRQSCGGR